MNSCIYQGQAIHARYHPVANGFNFKLFMMYLDLEELDEVFQGRWFWSTKHFNLAYLRRKDHFGDPTISLDQSVRNLVAKETGSPCQGPIRMLTHLRYLGYCFNPATLYYCYDQGGKELEAIVVEIHNTPWGEVFCYVLDQKMEEREGTTRIYSFDKDFHVSPFMDMNISYTWKFGEPGKELQVLMMDFHDEEKLFEAKLILNRRDLNPKNLAAVLTCHPLMTFKVTAGIYWQALRLWQKGCPFYTHPTKREQTED